RWNGPHEVDPVRQKLRELRRLLGDDTEDDPIEMRTSEDEIRVRLEHDLLVRSPGYEAVRPVSDRIAVERCADHPIGRDVLEQVLRLRLPVEEVGERVGVRCGEMEDDS